MILSELLNCLLFITLGVFLVFEGSIDFLALLLREEVDEFELSYRAVIEAEFLHEVGYDLYVVIAIGNYLSNFHGLFADLTSCSYWIYRGIDYVNG